MNYHSVRKRIRRRVLLPLVIVLCIIGVSAYGYTSFQMLPLRADWSITTGAFLPHDIEDDLWETFYGLKQYIEYRQTGSVGLTTLDPGGERVVPTLLSHPPDRSYAFLFPRQIDIYVPHQYRDMKLMELQSAYEDIELRLDLARVLDRRARFLDGILILASALAALFLLEGVFWLLSIRFWNDEGRNQANQVWRGFKATWRRIAIFASVIWGIVTALAINPGESAEFAVVLGPFVISLAVYLLFPNAKQRTSNSGRQ